MQLIVLGMHRSGTSSVTRLLNLAGAYFGPEGIATDPNEENPKGFWERRDVRAVCDGLLRGGGFEWWRVADFAADRIEPAALHEHTDAFRRVVYQLDAHRPWVMKEPRLCLVLPVLRPTLEAPVFVHVLREPIEVAESLATRNEFPVPVGLALWEIYTVHALAATAGEARVFVSYGDLMRDPVQTIADLLGQLTELGVQGLRLPAEREITGFISPSLHRERQDTDARAGYLNATQAALAAALDDRRWDLVGDHPAVSAGATATLRLFEGQQALVADLDEQQRAAQAELARMETVTEALGAAHQQTEDRLRAAHQQTEDRLRAAHQQVEAELREAEWRAVASLAGAEQKIHAIKASGAVRLGARLSAARDRIRGRSSVGVDGALRGALRHIEQARLALEGPAADGSPLIGEDAPEPPPIDEMRIARRAARAHGGRAKVAVLAWDVGHNPFGRAHLLADLLRDRFEVELWGTQFDRYGTDVWPPLRGTSIPVHRIRGGELPEFLGTLDDVARRIDADLLYVSKPRLPSLALGVLAKERWNRPLIVDIDDFEPSFFDEDEGLSVDEIRRRRDDPDLVLPFGRLWTRACESAVRSADQVTVSNRELEARYGGVIVPHARNEAVFDPSRYDRTEERRRLGLREADRLLLFGGTPRAHKGIVDLLEALEALGDDHLRVGVFGTRELADLRPQIGDLAHWIHPLPYQSFDDLPRLLAAVDLTCALQSPDHPVSRFQMPAKVTDALAMGLPCLVTPVPPLQPLIDKDVVEVFDGGRPLHERIRQILDRPDETADRARRGREAFLESQSYSAVRPAVEAAVGALLDDPPPLAPALASLVGTAREIFQPGAAAPTAAPAPRRRLAADTTYDLAVFWKQNDTGIYGRRQDMFVKYLERSGRFRSIVHFDQPMSAEALALVARRSVGESDQNRLVLRQTLRRLRHGSDRGRLRQRTFVYAAGPISRALKLPRRDAYVRYVRAELDRAGFGGRPVMCWTYPTNPWLPDVLDALAPDVVVADVVDDNRTWYEPGTPRYLALEQNYADLLARSDVVLANCEPVAARMRGFAPRVEVVPNACELPDLAPPGPRPAALDRLTGPIIGYSGNLSDRIDLPLLRALVRARREWSFVFLGSTHTDKSVLDLAGEPNVRFVGTVPYEEAKAIIRYFDVALIPHLDNEMTQAMNPLKAFVYASLGVPIVSTPVANLDELSEHIIRAEGPEGFIAAIEAALAAGRRPPDPEELRAHSWEVRVEQVLALVDDAVSTRPEGVEP